MKRKEEKASGASQESPPPADAELAQTRPRRAYELNEQQGRQDEFNLEHWLQAERELAGKRSRQPNEQINHQPNKIVFTYLQRPASRSRPRPGDHAQNHRVHAQA